MRVPAASSVARPSIPVYLSKGTSKMLMAGSIFAAATGRAGLARVLATARTALIVLGWAAAQFPFLVVPDLAIESSAAPEAALRAALAIIAAGSLVLFPAFFALYAVFKSRVVSG